MGFLSAKKPVMRVFIDACLLLFMRFMLVECVLKSV